MEKCKVGLKNCSTLLTLMIFIFWAPNTFQKSKWNEMKIWFWNFDEWGNSYWVLSYKKLGRTITTLIVLCITSFVIWNKIQPKSPEEWNLGDATGKGMRKKKKHFFKCLNINKIGEHQFVLHRWSRFILQQCLINGNYYCWSFKKLFSWSINIQK